jgi:hypothetical protein
VSKWLCTDTWVGSHAYFLDGVLVAAGFQPARKSYMRISFVSTEAATKLREFILSMVPNEELNFDIIDQNRIIDDKVWLC